MALSYEEQLKCVEIWNGLTGEYSSPDQWNDNAANLLAEMVAKINHCSVSMHLVPRPTGSRPGLFWLLTEAYGALKRYLTTDNSRIYIACRSAAVVSYKTKITEALQGG